MEIQYGKMILYGILTALFYIALPLVVIYFVELYNIMTFNQSFITYLIIFGCIGIALSMARHAFPEDTSANRIVAFISAVYSGIYLFYIFGGFTPGVSYGTYYINTPTIQVLLGLQTIAWLFLISTGISALKYLIEAIELRKKKEYRVKAKKSFRLSRVFKGLGTLMSLVIMGYFASLVFSGLNLDLNIDDTYGLGWDDGGTPVNPADDSINVTMSFDVGNQGLYAIYDVYLDLYIYTLDTDNPPVLPENTLIGQSLGNYYGTFHAFTNYMDQNLTAYINPLYAPGLATTDANLKLQISFTTLYANINIDVNVSVTTPWTALIP
ncbi:MAG: hypothetical protein EU542_01230 [Promethearchaeota archaeon]|nr:MAG: hypothetical protein EU542_01230 [Candidatus Lokiarchaeota archaeon]